MNRDRLALPHNESAVGSQGRCKHTFNYIEVATEGSLRRYDWNDLRSSTKQRGADTR